MDKVLRTRLILVLIFVTIFVLAVHTKFSPLQKTLLEQSSQSPLSNQLPNQKSIDSSILPINATTVIAKGVYSTNGYTAGIALQIPINGGKITGTISNDCEGVVDGNYDSNTTSFQGNVKGTCHIFLISVDANASMNGKIDLSKSTGVMNFSATESGKNLSGTIDLKLTPY